MLRTGFNVLRILAIIVVLAYAGALALLYYSQERLIFRPTTLPIDYRFEFDQPFEEMRIAVPGAELDALLFRQPAPRGLVFFLHGNAGNLRTWTTGLDFYRRVNYDLFILDYRGYGRSTGSITSERELQADVRAAWDAIAPRYAGRPIVIYGRSLGTGLAAQLAREVNPALLVLVSPYASLVAAGQREYPFVPEWLIKYPLRTDAMIGDVTSPVLLLHGSSDRLIPPGDSKALLARTRSPAELLLIDGAGHSDIHRFAPYLDALAARLIAAGGG